MANFIPYPNSKPRGLKNIEDELNSYPIEGFQFRVDRLESSVSLFSSRQLRLDIRAEYKFPNPANPEYVLTWFCLVLNDYVDRDSENSLEICFTRGKTTETRAYLTINC